MNIKRKKIMSAVLAAVTALTAAGNMPTETSAVFGSTRPDTETVDITVKTDKNKSRISPYIYGINDNCTLSDVTVTALKQSSVGVSSYNWETNAANMGAANDYINGYDLVSAFSKNVMSTPALHTKQLMDKAGLYDIPLRFSTLQMMGYVANDAAGVVGEGESRRWAEVFVNKNSDLLIYPDVHDDAVYMDEYISYLVNSYSFASDGGINGYFLDREPEHWHEEYGVLELDRITAEELVKRSSSLADTVKAVDPSAIVLGPSVGGIEAFVNLGNEDDWNSYKENYSWFIDYYLDNMRIASEKKNKRLLDVLDLHFITEARSVLLESVIDSDSKFANEERMQAVRVLWDSDYTENSSNAIIYKQHTPIIPTIQASIRMYYPGTKLSFSEYDFGGGENISGGVAQADVLGIFGREGVYLACLRPSVSDPVYQKSAINLYTDYDGAGASFGDISVYADNGGDTMSSVYASVESDDSSALKMVLINKNTYSEKPANVAIESDTEYHYANIYSFNETSSEIVFSGMVEEIEDNSFEFIMDPLTVYMLEFGSDDIMQEEIVTEQTEEAETSETITDISETEITAVQSETEASVTETEVVSDTEQPVSSAETSETEKPVTEIPSETSAAHESSAEEISEQTTVVIASQTEITSVHEEPEEPKQVPMAVKVIVSLLVAAVAVTIIYVLVTDIILSHKRR